MKVRELQSTEIELHAVIKRSIDRIDAAQWDSINAAHGLYLTHRFLTCVESSGVANANHWYLLVYRENDLVATAVLSSFVVSLDLLLPGYMQRLCNAVRRVYPPFFRLRMLFCGIPVSIGKHTLAISDKVPAEQVLAEVSRQMLRVARENGIRYLCFKEFAESDFPDIRLLESHGYIRAHSIPRVQLDVVWSSFAEYLRAMRHGYRRKVRQSLQKVGITDDSFPLRRNGNSDSNFPRMVVAGYRLENATRMHELYLQVMQRASVKLEVLNRRFFERLAEIMPQDLALLCLQSKDGVQGAALLGRNGPRLNFLLVGFDYNHRDQYQTYFNLLNGIIAYGIEERFESIDLGQTTYQIKQRLGGRAEPVYFYLRCLSPVIHFLLRCCRRVLFPPTRLTRRHVLRASDS
jgi:predicted N-acyltransferase